MWAYLSSYKGTFWNCFFFCVLLDIYVYWFRTIFCAVGPGKDIFRETRATGEPVEGHKSNFLHPVLYYYKQLPTSKYYYYLLYYRLGPVNSKSFVGKVLLRIKWKFELQH